MLGGLILPSHESTWEMESRTGPNLSFWNRLKNFLIMSKSLYFGYHQLLPAHQQLAEKYFGPDVPQLTDILKNTSVLFVNQPAMLTPARPRLANIVPFSSFHINENSEPMTQVRVIKHEINLQTSKRQYLWDDHIPYFVRIVTFGFTIVGFETFHRKRFQKFFGNHLLQSRYQREERRATERNSAGIPRRVR